MEDKRAEDCADAVDQDIGGGTGSRWHEGLVKFVGGGVERCEAHGQAGEAPVPCVIGTQARGSEAAPDECGEDAILREMGAFSDDEDDGLNRFRREVAREPAQDGLEQR